MAEAWTSGMVSRDARKGWQQDTIRSERGRSFVPEKDGYRMIAWESEIAMARAMGRGVASGKDKPTHRYDRIGC
jgi:hypothetical protein